MYYPIDNINTPSINSNENIINNRNNDVLNAINNYQYPKKESKISLKINTNLLHNNKYTVYKTINDKTTTYEINQTELDSLLEQISKKNNVSVEYITEPLNSDYNSNDNYYELPRNFCTSKTNS